MSCVENLNILIAKLNLTDDFNSQVEIAEEIDRLITENFSLGEEYYFKNEGDEEYSRGELALVFVDPGDGVVYSVDTGEEELKEFTYIYPVEALTQT